MPTVFLSYSRLDLPLIEQLAARLRASSPEIAIWRDQEKIYGGQKWPEVLGAAIADQDIFLLAWSKNAAASHFVELEWNTAIALKKTIIPYLLACLTTHPSLHRSERFMGIQRRMSRDSLLVSQTHRRLTRADEHPSWASCMTSQH